jgi:hypothetical protein
MNEIIVEINISSMTKTKAKSLILNLFCQCDIDDENDINETDYKLNELMLIENVSIKFKNLEGKNHLNFFNLYSITHFCLISAAENFNNKCKESDAVLSVELKKVNI